MPHTRDQYLEAAQNAHLANDPESARKLMMLVQSAEDPEEVAYKAAPNVQQPQQEQERSFTPLQDFAYDIKRGIKAIPGVANQLGGYGQDLARGATDFPIGLASHAVGAVDDLTHIANIADSDIERTNFQQPFRELEQDRRDATTSQPMRMMGNVLSGGYATKGVDMGAKLGEKVVRGGGIGGLFGAATPAVSDEESALMTGIGTTAGVTIPAVVAGGQWTGKTAINIARSFREEGQEKIARDAMHKTADSRDTRLAMAKLLEEEQVIPGAGAGEIAAPAGRAPFAALQRIAEKKDSSGYLKMTSDGNQGRVAKLGEISGTADERAAALALREENAGINYGKAYAKPVEADAELNKILKNPYVQKAHNLARDEAITQGVHMPKAGTSLAPKQGTAYFAQRKGEGLALQLRDRGSSAKKMPDADRTKYLQLVKEGLDKMLSRTGDEALDRTGRRSVLKLQRELVAWLEKRNPDFRTARTQFAEDSVVPNQQNIGVVLKDKLSPPGEDVITQEGLMLTNQSRPAYTGALRKGPKTVKDATGRSQELSEALTPPQMQATEDVAQSLARRKQFEVQSRVGGGEAEEILSGATPVLPSIGMFKPEYNVLRSISARLAGRVQGKSLELLAQIMKDPKRAAELMRQIPTSDQPLVIEALKQAQMAATLTAPQAGRGRQ